VTLEGQRDGSELELHARFVIDATGPRGFLHRALRLGEAELANYPATEALYSHFSGVRRLEDTRFARTAETPPYPIDDAAAHHVFDGGWVWVLQFNNGMTSAGVAATDTCASQLRFADKAPAWGRLLERIPALKEQFAAAEAERPLTHMPRLSFRSARIAGRRWALLPSAAGFVDPLLSTGFPLTLLGISRLAEIIADDWEKPRFAERLQDYAAQTDAELLATARLIAALYANMKHFPVFTALSLLYFAAASYSEAARRLGKSHLASSFLLCSHSDFGPQVIRLCERSRQPLTKPEADLLIRDILTAIEPFNIAGFGRPERRNWYPVEARDLMEDAGKLGTTQQEVRMMLLRCGFEQERELTRS
jgi:FADH2 O2-dependent halogenase